MWSGCVGVRVTLDLVRMYVKTHYVCTCVKWTRTRCNRNQHYYNTREKETREDEKDKRRHGRCEIKRQEKTIVVMSGSTKATTAGLLSRNLLSIKY